MLIGRPYVYGLAVAGEAGVREVLENLRAELDLTMALAGCHSLAEVGPETPAGCRLGAVAALLLAAVALAGCGEKPEPDLSKQTAVTGTVDLARTGPRAPATATTRRTGARVHRPRPAAVEPRDAEARRPASRPRWRSARTGASGRGRASSGAARTASCSQGTSPG